MTHEEREKTLRQLVEYAKDISAEYGISIVLTACIEEKVADNAVVQSTSHLVLGNDGALKRMLASAFNKTDDFKKLMIVSLMHSFRMSTEEITTDEQTKKED